MIPSGLTSTSSNGIGAISTSAASLENGAADKPWKDFDQSTCFSPSSMVSGSSAMPRVRSVRGDWSSIEAFLAGGAGVAFGAADEAAGGVVEDEVRRA